MRRWLWILLVVAAAPLLGGCCSLYGLFCGPDRSEWVSVSFRSPQAAVSTLREALRRDNLDVLYRCLGEDYKRRHGMSQVSLTIFWQQLREDVPGIHLLGDAEVAGPIVVDEARVRYVLSYGSTRIAVALVRQPLLEVRYRVPGAGDEPAAAYAESLTDYLRVTPGEFTSRVELVIPSATLPDGSLASDLTEVLATYDWKVDDLRRVEDGAEVVPEG